MTRLNSSAKGAAFVKKIFAAVLILIVMGLTGCDCLTCNKKLVVGVDDDFPPMGFRDEDGNIIGFDVDLAKEAARRMNANVEFKPIEWSRKREAITSGKVDMIWNGLDISDERKEYMIFTKPYMDDRQVLLVMKDSELDIYSEYDLADKIVGTQAGSTSADYINENPKLKDAIREHKNYRKFNDVLEALKSGEIDVLVCDELIARYELCKNPEQLELIDIKIGSTMQTAIGFSKDNVELRDEVQKVFDEMIKDGTAKKISEQWFNADLIKSKI